MKKKQPKIVIWDLEFKGSNNWRGELKIWPGYILCFAAKELGKPKTKTILSRRQYPGKDVNDDRALVKAILHHLHDVDLHIFHYGSKIDFRFIQTKALQYGFKPLPEPPVMIDTCTLARSKLALISNAMRNMAEFFGLTEKKKISHSEWNKAFALENNIMKKVERRCMSDVEITEQFLKKLKPVLHNHPALYFKGCPACGSPSLRSDGLRSTTKTTYRRMSCKSCGVRFQERIKKHEQK